MVQLNLALREINCKVVYFGCGLSGKTTNLEIIHERASKESRGDLTSIATESDRTLFFDFMPLDLGTVSGMRVKFQLYTVPGQVYYNSTRKLVLRGADGVVFVADSQRAKMDENLESLANLEECLREQGRSLDEMPHVIQFNKRDLPEVCTNEELEATLNRYKCKTFESIAARGDGVLETFKALAGIMLERVKNMSTESASKPTVQSQRMAAASNVPPAPTPVPVSERPRAVTDSQRLQGGMAGSTPAHPQPASRVESRLLDRRTPLAQPVLDPVAPSGRSREALRTPSNALPAAKRTPIAVPQNPRLHVGRPTPGRESMVTSGMMISTSVRRRSGASGLLMALAGFMVAAVAAAAWWFFLLR